MPLSEEFTASEAPHASPEVAFSDLGLNPQLVRTVEKLGYQAPTAVQAQAIPLVLAGHDLLGIAPTGTGKTAAYVLPLLMKLKYAQGEHPRAVIIAPTRELAMQISVEFERFAEETDLRMAVLYGGLGPKTQKEQLAAGVDILIATPGRLLDLYLEGHIYLKGVATLVLDEADKMMDMGFMPQIRRLLEILPRKRQNLLFSATMPPKVETLSEEFLEYPHKVEVAPESTPVETVTQWLYAVENVKTKLDLLEYLLRDEEAFHRVMVFVKTKDAAEVISKYLHKKVRGTVKVIHANKGQNTRINAMEAFRMQEVRLLVTTDVSARGIDIPKVSHVVNFDVPLVYEDYVHRIGRTGRAQSVGTAITFMLKHEAWHVAKIEKLIRMSIPRAGWPADVMVSETPFEEEQMMLRIIDEQKKKDNPEYKGAFHDKKLKQGITQKQAALFVRDKKKKEARKALTDAMDQPAASAHRLKQKPKPKPSRKPGHSSSNPSRSSSSKSRGRR